MTKLTFNDLGTYAESAGVVMIGAAGTVAAGFSLLGLGTWIYNKISGSHITIGEAGYAVLNIGGLLAEWAHIICRMSKG